MGQRLQKCPVIGPRRPLGDVAHRHHRRDLFRCGRGEELVHTEAILRRQALNHLNPKSSGREQILEPLPWREGLEVRFPTSAKMTGGGS